MAEQKEGSDVECEDEVDHGYKAPAQMSLSEIQNKDADDESLQRYKQALLGQQTEEVPFPEDPRRVIVEKMVFCSDDRPKIEMDLRNIKDTTFVVKEGTQYHLEIHFFVQREIVTGLRYRQKTSRKGIKVDASNVMVGSYGPKKEAHVFATQKDELPSGMLARGKYKIEGFFTDDDKAEHLKWSFSLEIKKDWED